MPQPSPSLTFSTSGRCLYRDRAEEEHLPLVCWGRGLLYGGQVRPGGQEGEGGMRRKEEGEGWRGKEGVERDGVGF